MGGSPLLSRKKHAQSIDRAGEPPLSLFNYSRDSFFFADAER
jgi:hypothetical protein